MKVQKIKRIWFAMVCLILASITAAILIKSIFFRAPTEYDLELLPTIAYFTTQSNIIVILWLLYTGLKELLPGLPEVKPVVGMMVSCYISVTCIVYWLVLVPMLGFAPALFTAKNIWLHTVTSIFVPVVFLGFTEGQSIRPRGILTMLIYPACYVIFAYVVHAFTGKYAYPFLNPEAMGTGFVFVMGLVLIATLFMGLGLAYRHAWNKRTQTSVEVQRRGYSV